MSLVDYPLFSWVVVIHSLHVSSFREAHHQEIIFPVQSASGIVCNLCCSPPVGGLQQRLHNYNDARNNECKIVELLSQILCTLGICCTISETYPVYIAGMFSSYFAVILCIAKTKSAIFDPFLRRTQKFTIGPFEFQLREEQVNAPVTNSMKLRMRIFQFLYKLLLSIIIIIIFINCNWFVTRWQWLFYMYTKHEIGHY